MGTRERSGALPYPLVETNEKRTFMWQSNSVVRLTTENTHVHPTPSTQLFLSKRDINLYHKVSAVVDKLHPDDVARNISWWRKI